MCITYPFSIKNKNFIHSQGETFNLRMDIFLELALLISNRGLTSHSMISSTSASSAFLPKQL